MVPALDLCLDFTGLVAVAKEVSWTTTPDASSPSPGRGRMATGRRMGKRTTYMIAAMMMSSAESWLSSICATSLIVTRDFARSALRLPFLFSTQPDRAQVLAALCRRHPQGTREPCFALSIHAADSRKHRFALDFCRHCSPLSASLPTNARPKRPLARQGRDDDEGHLPRRHWPEPARVSERTRLQERVRWRLLTARLHNPTHRARMQRPRGQLQRFKGSQRQDFFET